MPQQTLHTRRLTLVPLGEEHLDWEVELDSDPEVMRYLTGRARTRQEVAASHARRLATAQKVDGLGYRVGLVDSDFVGWWILQPAHGPDQPDPWEGIGEGEVEYELTRAQWEQRSSDRPD